MTDNTKPQANVALPATTPHIYHPTYDEYALKRVLAGETPRVPLFQSDPNGDFGVFVADYSHTPLIVNLPVLTINQAREGLRQILLKKQAAFAKRYAEEQAKITEELQKLAAIGYDSPVAMAVSEVIESPEAEEEGRLQAQAEADAKAEFDETHDAPDSDYPNKWYGTSITPTYPEDE